jgi:hypothetical protein
MSEMARFDESVDKENYNPCIKEFTPTKARPRKRYMALKEIAERSERREEKEEECNQEREMDVFFSTFPGSPFKSRSMREL